MSEKSPALSRTPLPKKSNPILFPQLFLTSYPENDDAWASMGEQELRWERACSRTGREEWRKTAKGVFFVHQTPNWSVRPRRSEAVRLTLIQLILVAVSISIFPLLVLHTRCAESTHVLLQFAGQNLLLARSISNCTPPLFQDTTRLTTRSSRTSCLSPPRRPMTWTRKLF